MTPLRKALSYCRAILRELFALLSGADREGTDRAWYTLILIALLWLLILYLQR